MSQTIRYLGVLSLAALCLMACAPEKPAVPARSSLPAPDSSEGIVCTAPIGEDADFGEFTWEYELPPGGHFQVAVYDFNAGHPLGPRRRSDKLEEARWKPRAHQTRGWAKTILWRVHAYDQAGELVARGEAVARGPARSGRTSR